MALQATALTHMTSRANRILLFMFRCNYVSPLLPFHFAKVQKKIRHLKKTNYYLRHICSKHLFYALRTLQESTRSHRQRASITKKLLCHLSQKQHRSSLSTRAPSQKQHRSSLSTRAPKSVYTKRSTLHARMALHEAKLPYTSRRLFTRAKHLRTPLCVPHASCRGVRCCSNLVTLVADWHYRHAKCN